MRAAQKLEILLVLLHHILDDGHSFFQFVETFLSLVGLYFHFIVGRGDQFKVYFPAVSVHCTFSGQKGFFDQIDSSDTCASKLEISTDFFGLKRNFRFDNFQKSFLVFLGNVNFRENLLWLGKSNSESIVCVIKFIV